MKTGEKVVCIDDEGWLRDMPGPSPRKGEVYTIRLIHRFGGVLGVALVEFDDPGEDIHRFYRACRFRPVAPIPCPTEKTHQEEGR